MGQTPDTASTVTEAQPPKESSAHKEVSDKSRPEKKKGLRIKCLTIKEVIKTHRLKAEKPRSDRPAKSQVAPEEQAQASKQEGDEKKRRERTETDLITCGAILAHVLGGPSVQWGVQAEKVDARFEVCRRIGEGDGERRVCVKGKRV